MALLALGVRIGVSLLTYSSSFREDQMEFLCYKAERSNSRAIIPMRIVSPRIPGFRFRHFPQVALCNSVYSHNLANSQSRLTVTREILSTSAISS